MRSPMLGAHFATLAVVIDPNRLARVYDAPNSGITSGWSLELGMCGKRWDQLDPETVERLRDGRRRNHITGDGALAEQLAFGMHEDPARGGEPRSVDEHHRSLGKLADVGSARDIDHGGVDDQLAGRSDLAARADRRRLDRPARGGEGGGLARQQADVQG